MGWTGALPPPPHAIPYAGLIISPRNSHFSQFHLNLTDATHWMDHYNGFSYEEFYEFIIDFFEADTTPEGQSKHQRNFSGGGINTSPALFSPMPLPT